jgi:hypothetical protein
LDAGATVRAAPAQAPLQAVAPVPSPQAAAVQLAQPAPAAPALMTRNMRGSRDPSWSSQVLGKEEQVDSLIHDLQADIESMSSGVESPPSTIVAATIKNAAQQAPGNPAVGELVLPHLVSSFVLKEDAQNPVDSAQFAEFFPMIIWHSLSDVFVSKNDIVITNIDGPSRKVTFTVTPTNQLADIHAVEQKLKSEIEDPQSDLRSLLPGLDPTISVVTVAGLSQAIPGGADGAQTLGVSTSPSPPSGVAKAIGNPDIAAGGAGAAPGAAPGAARASVTPGDLKDMGKEKLAKALSGEGKPMTTTMYCIVFMTVQFFAVATLDKVVTTVNKVSATKFQTLEDMLTSAMETIKMAPMLCILYLGTRMRANQLGVEPQQLTQQAMLAASYGLLAGTVMTLIQPMLSSVAASLGGVIAAINFLIMLGIYGGAGTVVYGLITLEADPTVWPDGPPPVAPAVAATINLLVQYFAVALIFRIFFTLVDLKVQPMESWRYYLEIFDQAAKTANFAPMLAVLFIGTRMRALQIDPKAGPGSGVPQPWAQTCFYVTAYAVLGQTILTILVPIVGGGKLKPSDDPDNKDDVTFEIANKGLATAVTVVKYLLLVGMYGATVAIVYANFTMKGQDGTAPPLAPSMINVMILVTAFFLTYAALFLLLTLRDLAEMKVGKAVRAFGACSRLMLQAPMLSVLFLAARMRAQELTDGVGMPQGWVVEAMFISSGALLAQLLFTLITGLVSWGPLIAISSLFEYATMVLQYVGITAVVIGILIMQPEVLDGKGGVVYYKML